MDAPAIADALRASPFTAGLGRSDRRRLESLATLRTVAVGDVLLREGEETPHLGIVVEGRIALRLLVPGRGPITVLTVEEGDLFGWSAIVPPYRATSSAIAVAPGKVVLFDAAALREALASDDDLAAAIHPRLLQIVVRRLGATRAQLLDLFATEGARAW
ncbi:MAG TPA: cyclic nucleotide-binding domain-containing protein [Candidatus Deferrimicrobium sp.]|nr:cyclic nucleotide-binding domain-containing protein [Candidatus Deferrimicrobium sp.]